MKSVWHLGYRFLRDHGKIGDCEPGGYDHIWAIQLSAAVKGMVFKQFSLE